MPTLGLRSLSGLRPPRYNTSRSALSTESQIVWEWLAACYGMRTATGLGGPSRGADTASTGVTSDRGRQGTGVVQQTGFSSSVQRLWVANLLSCTRLLGFELSQGMLDIRRGDRAGQGYQGGEPRLAGVLPQHDPYIYISLGIHAYTTNKTENTSYMTRLRKRKYPETGRRSSQPAPCLCVAYISCCRHLALA